MKKHILLLAILLTIGVTFASPYYYRWHLPPRNTTNNTITPLNTTELDKEINTYPNYTLHIGNNQCPSFIYNGDPKTKINIAVIPSGFDNLSQAQLALKDELFNKNMSLFKQEPYKSRQKDFNFYLYTTILPNVTSNTSRSIDPIWKKSIDSEVANCTYNAYLVFIAQNKYTGGETGTNYSELYITKSTIYNWSLYPSYLSGVFGIGTTHEVGGHLLGNLADTYYDENSTYTMSYPILNCDYRPTCDKFSAFNTSCYGGTSCGWYKGNNYKYRPSQGSIMGVGNIAGRSWNKPEQYAINKTLDKQLNYNKGL